MAKTTLEQVTCIVAEHLGVDMDQVTSDASLVALGADSLDHFEIIMAIEDTFGLVIPNNDVDSITTAGQIAAYVDQRLAAKAGA